MNVTKLLYELFLTPEVEIVVASLPEGIGGAEGQSARDSLLQRLHSLGKGSALGLAYQHVYVFGHDYVAVHVEAVSLPNPFQRGFEGGTGFWRAEIWSSSVTAES